MKIVRRRRGKNVERPPRAVRREIRARERKPYPWASLYYRLRRKIGLPAISAERRHLQQILHPGGDWRKVLKSEDDERVRRAMMCLAAGTVLAVLSFAAGAGKMRTVILRPEVGEAELETEIAAEYGGGNYEIPVTLTSRLYTAEELEKAKEKAAANVSRSVLAGNPDWDHVSSDLDFSGGTGVPGISVSWESGDPERIAADGTVTAAADNRPESGAGIREEAGTAADAAAGMTESGKVAVTAVFEYEDEQWERTFYATLVPGSRTPQEADESLLAGELARAASDRSKAEIILPRTAGGRVVRYPDDDVSAAWMLVLLGVTAAGACMMLPVQRNRQAEKQRSEELMLCYPELVTNLTVLMSAGLSVRAAWESIVSRYQYRCSQGEPRKIVYEEMTYVRNLMQQGTFEEEAYPEFGRRCGLPPYLRLGSLLGNNIRRGNQGLLPLLREEADRAMDTRLRSARKRGEEVSSKLLLPMMLLLGLVLVILMAPAFMSF